MMSSSNRETETPSHENNFGLVEGLCPVGTVLNPYLEYEVEIWDTDRMEEIDGLACTSQGIKIENEKA